jgi:hypothetical protein
MRDNPQYAPTGAAKRCAICDGQFGLVRHYSWRTALCSKKCAGQFRTRQEGDRRWLRSSEPPDKACSAHRAAFPKVQDFAARRLRSDPFAQLLLGSCAVHLARRSDEHERNTDELC